MSIGDTNTNRLAFISYKHTGENESSLIALLQPIKDALTSIGLDVYCNLFDECLPARATSFFGPEGYVFDAFKNIDGAGLLFVVLNSQQKSEGMILEMGYAIAKGVPVIVAVKDGVENTYIPRMAEMIIGWNDLPDLLNKIVERSEKIIGLVSTQ